MGLSGAGGSHLDLHRGSFAQSASGLRLGRGERLDEITRSLGMVAEGVKTTAAVHELAGRLGVEAPLTAAVHHILYDGRPPREVVDSLMTRTLREE